MAAINNIPREIQESIRDVLDKRVKVSIKRMVKMEVRQDKMDNRVLAFSPCRLFILTAKTPSKLEASFHFLDLQSIESKKSGQLSIGVEGKTYTFHSLEPGSDEMDHMITHVGISLKQIFPAFPLERLIVKLEVQPAKRLKTMHDMIQNLEGRDVGACAGFTTMYQCMCDYHGTPFREEVAWDVDTIYLSHDCRELRLQDFDHLSSKDLIPIVSALEHNVWFKKVNCSNVKLTMEVCNELLKVMRRNAVIEDINLSNTGIKMEFVQKLSTALISNSGTQLNTLDLSNNLLEDKAITHLMGAIKLLPCGLVRLDLSRTGMSTRCLNKLGEVLGQCSNVMSVMESLQLNDNGLKGEDFPMMYNCLAQPNSISELDLSATDCALDALCDPLLRGCLNLTTLRLSRTIFTHKKSKEVVVPQSWKLLFASACCLQLVDVSSCKLPAEAFKELLLGLASNRSLKNLKLNVSSNELGAAGASILTSVFGPLTCVSSLDISNNGFDTELKTILPELSKNVHLKSLSVGRNFANIKPKNMPEVMLSLVHYIQDESSGLESLSIADSKLRTDTTYIINALGSNSSLQEIDISGNLIGDIGARMLAKALQINTKLHTVVWDKNSVLAQGFEDVADALSRNLTLKKMPFPVNDASVSLRMYPDRTEVALQKIESILQRNHSPRRFAADQAYRLQQGFLISSTQQMVDRLVVKVQDTLNALNSLGSTDECSDDMALGQKLVQDADNSQKLFSSLQGVALKSEGAGNMVEKHFQDMATQLKDILQLQMAKTVEEMFSCAQSQCPTVMSNEKFAAELNEGCEAKTVLPTDFTNSVLEGATTDVYNWTGEMHLAAAAHISDTVIDEVIESLSSSHKSLTNHLNLRKSGQYKDKAEDTVSLKEPKVSMESSPKLTNKRKSMLNRKTRPQSTMARERRNSTLMEGEEGEEERIYQNLPLSSGEAALSTTPEHTKASLIHVEEKSSENSPGGSVDVLGDLGEVVVTAPRPLQHVNKTRPRREKAHRPTRPVLATGTTEMEESPENGIRTSVQSSPGTSAVEEKQHAIAGSSQKAVKRNNSSAKSEDNSNKPNATPEAKPEQPKKSLFGLGFRKTKNKEEKPEKEPKPEKESKKGLGSFSLFKKRPSAHDGGTAGLEKPPPGTAEAPVEAVPHIIEPVEEGHSLEQEKKTESKEAVKEHVEALSEETQTEVKKDKGSPKVGHPVTAILPPTRKKSAPKATEEDFSLGDEKMEADKSSASQEAEEPATEKVEEGVLEGEKTDRVAKLAGMGGMAALGGRNLLEEMKMKQEKRFSQHIPSPSQEEKRLPSPTKSNGNESTKEKSEDASKEDQKKGKESTGQPNDTSDSVKDVNHNMADELKPVAPAKASPPTRLAKPPSPAPRAVVPPKRPPSIAKPTDLAASSVTAPATITLDKPPTTVVPPSSVSESESSALPTVSAADSTMETSSPNSGCKDSTPAPVPVARPRPPPTKPRPPLVPRPKKRDSATEESPAVPSSPQVTSPEPSLSFDPKPDQAEEGIVYDSATLRLSVKDKIKKMSQSKVLEDPPKAEVKTAKQKAMSLPKDAKLPEVLPEELNSDEAVEKVEKLIAEEWSTLKETDEEEETKHEEETNTIVGAPDDEIMV